MPLTTSDTQILQGLSTQALQSALGVAAQFVVDEALEKTRAMVQASHGREEFISTYLIVVNSCVPVSEESVAALGLLQDTVHTAFMPESRHIAPAKPAPAKTSARTSSVMSRWSQHFA